MDLDQNKSFDTCIESFKKLKLKDKQKEVISSLKEGIAFLTRVHSLNNNKADILYNREVLDINKENYTEDDFAEAVFVYTYAIKELMAGYVEIKEDL